MCSRLNRFGCHLYKLSGISMCRNVRVNLDGTPIILVSTEGTQPDPRSGASFIMIHPFISRKLLNRVVRVIPDDESYSLEAESIKLNHAKKKTRCLNNVSRLSPKLVHLLELFIHHPGSCSPAGVSSDRNGTRIIRETSDPWMNP